MKIRIYYEDTDAGGIVYHANYIKFCERARSEMFFNSSLRKFDENYHFVVTKIEASYLKPAFLGDILEVKTKVLNLKKASLSLEQSIYKGESLIFKATIKVAFLRDKKPSPMDEEMVCFLKNYLR